MVANKTIRRKNYIQLIFTGIFLLLISFLITGPASAADLSGKVIPQGLRTAEGIFVYVVKAEVPEDALKQKYVMDQRQLTFIPHILPIMVGAEVDFPNNDQVGHNVFSLSSIKKFNLGSYKTGLSKTMKFDKPGVVEIRCDVHQEMNAYILVLKNPYFAVTDKDGQFTISGLAPGEYQVKTWHPKLKSSKKKVEITKSNDLKIEFKPKRGSAGVLYK